MSKKKKNDKSSKRPERGVLLMKWRFLKKYTSILMIGIMLSSLILQNVYAFNLPVLGRSEKATASNATASDLASGSDWGKIAGLGESDVLMTAASESMDFTSGNEMKVSIYIKNVGTDWIYDGDLERLTASAKSEDDEDADVTTDCFTDMQQMDENGEWVEAEFPEEIISYDVDQLQEPELNGLVLAPGTAYRMTYSYTVEDTEEPKASSLEFRFKGTKKSGDKVTTRTQLYYNVDGWNLELNEVEASVASDSDAEITVKVDGWQDLIDTEEEASASNASEYAAWKMNTLIWKVSSDAELEDVRRTDNGDGTVTFKFFYADGLLAGPHLFQVTAKGTYKGTEYRSSESLAVRTDGETEPEEQVTRYQYEDDDVIVDAEVVSDNPEALPADSKLVAEKITDSEQLAQIAQKILQETGQIYDCSHAYDIRFEQNGEEIEPTDAVVKVQIQYRESVALNETVKQDPQQDVKLLHLTKEDTIEDVTAEIATNEAGDVEAASFEATSFSIFVLTQAVPNGTTFKYEDDTMTITASVDGSAGIPADAELVVETVGQEDVRFQAAKAKLDEYKNSDTSTQILEASDLLLYDFYFRDGKQQKITLDAAAVVQIDFIYNTTSTHDTVGESKPIVVYQMGTDLTLNEISGTVVMNGNSVQQLNVQSRGTGLLWIKRSLYEHDKRTIFDYGGDYSLYTILGHFNSFVREDVESLNHTICSIAAGGNARLGSWGGKTVNINDPYICDIPSFIKGNLHIEDKDHPGTPGSINKTVKTVYTGETSTVYCKPDEEVQMYTSMNNQYIDFDAAFESIKNEVAAVPTADVIIDSNEVDKVFKGGSWPGYEYICDEYELHYVGEAEEVRVDLKKTDHIYQFDEFDHIGIINYAVDMDDSNILIVSPIDEPFVTVPTTYWNGENFIWEDTGNGQHTPVVDTEKGEGTGIAYLFPNMKGEMDLAGQNKFIGHVVAPDATVLKRGGDYNGCIIARNVKLDSEGHSWPYNGEIIKQAGLKLILGKQVNSTTPGEDQKFDFVLQELNQTSGTETPDITIQDTKLKDGKILQEVQNDRAAIDFSTISYGVDDAGEYYYKVYEKIPENDTKFNYDTNCYYIKVTVTVDEQKEADLKKTIVTVNKIDYWKAAKGTIVINEMPGNTAAIGQSGVVRVDLQGTVFFNNLSAGQVLLPETGSTGISKLLNLSVWLFLFGLMGIAATCWNSKKENILKK